MDHLILSDDRAFDDVFLTEKPVGREAQVRDIESYLGLAKAGRTRNLFIYGPPGSGKTVVCKWILNRFFSRNSVYVNVWSKQTTHKIMQELLHQLGYPVHGREPASELVQKFEKLGKRIVVCIDEADHMKDYNILYVLARSACAIILIANSTTMLSRMDSRINSSLFPAEIEFKEYTKEQIFDILKDRISFAFRPNTISENLLSVISGMCRGDARIALQILRIAGREAESKGLQKVTIEEVRSAAKSARQYGLSFVFEKLNEHQKVIYEILKKNGSMKSGTLYAQYCKVVTHHVVDRAYRNYMERMEEFGLVKSVGTGRWKKYSVV